MMVYKIDRRSVALILVNILFLISLSNLDVSRHHVYTLIFFIFIGINLVFATTLINHNHRHHPMFVSSLMNRIANLFISVSVGAPSTRLHFIHVSNHHRHFRSSIDATSYVHNARGVGLGRVISYLTISTIKMRQVLRSEKIPKLIRQQIRIEQIAIFVFALGVCAFNWRAFLFLILPIWIGGLFFLLTGNLANHDNCPLEAKFDHSRNFTNPIENWFFTNAGFHAAHHAAPNLHWSKLPSYHEKVLAPEVNREYVHNSYFYFLITNYLLKFRSN